MYQVRHPVVLFAAAILTVIGIGVGVLAASASQRFYGPSWGRFTVAFPGHLYSSEVSWKVHLASGSSREVSVLSYSSQPHFSWYSYSPGSDISAAYDQFSVSVRQGLPMRSVTADDRRAFFASGARGQDQDANGYSVVTIGPQCSDGDCTGVEVVGRGRVVWDLQAFWTGPPSKVEGFLGSFQPEGR
jgi:hypothetical protein